MAVASDLLLNGFRMELSSRTFTAYVREMPRNEELRGLREEIGESWFLYWREGKVFGLPRVPEPMQRFGESVELTFEDHPQLLAARIADILPEKFPKYHAFRRRPFSFLSQKNEVISLIRSNVSDLPDVLDRFQIRPRFELDAKLVELHDGETFVGVFVKVKTRWEIRATLEELKDEHIDLRGLYVVRRNPRPGQRRLVGKIGYLSNGTVTLSESFDGGASIDTSEVWIEGSRSSFAHCLKPILGNRYEEFEEERYRQEARFFTGPATDKLLKKMENYLRKASPFGLTRAGALTLRPLKPTCRRKMTSCRSGSYSGLR